MILPGGNGANSAVGMEEFYLYKEKKLIQHNNKRSILLQFFFQARQPQVLFMPWN